MGAVTLGGHAGWIRKKLCVCLATVLQVESLLVEIGYLLIFGLVEFDEIDFLDDIVPREGDFSSGAVDFVFAWVQDIFVVF